MVGIYKITNPSGKVYIGQSWNIRKRWSTHKSKKNEFSPIALSFAKYGKAEHLFEVLHELPKDITQATLDVYEKLYLSQYESCGTSMLNAKEAGFGGRHSDYSRGKISVANKGNRRPDLAAYNRLHKKGKTGHKHSMETRKKIRDSNMGRTCWAKGITQSAEVRKNKSDALTLWWAKRKGAKA